MFPSRGKEIETNIDTVKLISAIMVSSFCRDNIEETKVSSPVACLSAWPCNGTSCALNIKDDLGLLKN